MKISMETMWSLMSASCLLATCFRLPALGLLLIFVVVPFSIMVVAVTAPAMADGSSLDVSTRWLFFLLGKTFVFSVIGLVAVIVVVWLIVELGIARPNFHLFLLR
jgi:hypothetical protein